VSRRVHIRSFLRAVAAGCLLAQLAGLSHMLLVRHVTCAEHGELVHADGAVDEASTDVQADAADVRAAGDRPARDEHEHCAVAAGRHEPASVRRRAEVASTPDRPTSPPQRIERNVDAHSNWALHLLAPKSSPPADL
jgi:hypothetical protein